MSIKLYQTIEEMKGIGEEWLVDDNNEALAVFIDGVLTCSISYLADYRKGVDKKVYES